MDKFVAFMEKHFIPVASKIGAQRHLVAIRDSFMVSMPLMILGALAVMINNLPIPGFQELMNSIFGGESWKGFGAERHICHSFCLDCFLTCVSFS